MSLSLTDFVIGQLALFAWREAKRLAPGSRSAMLGIAEVIRNRVEAGWHGGDWLRIIQESPVHSASEVAEMDWRSMPEPHDNDFDWLIKESEGQYRRMGLPSVAITGTDNQQSFGQKAYLAGLPPQPTKALFYGSLQHPLREWFREKIVQNPAEHRKIGDCSTLSFFA